MTNLQKYYELQKTSVKKYQQFLKKLSNQTNSRKFFSLQNGSLEPRRKKLHSDIISDCLTKYSSQPTPSLHFILGSIGSGKTSLKDTVVKALKNKNLLYINFDDLKLQLPEYNVLKELNPKKAAQFVQSESAKLAGNLYKKATQKKVNIIYEKNIRLNKEGNLHIISEIKHVIKKQYHVIIHVVFLNSYQEAWKRVQLRYDETKRYVPLSDVKNTFTKLFPNLNIIMNENFNIEYSVKLWYNGNRDKETQAIGLVFFQKKRSIEISNKEKNLNAIFEGTNNKRVHYMGAIFNMQSLSKKARNTLKSIDILKRHIEIFEGNIKN